MPVAAVDMPCFSRGAAFPRVAPCAPCSSCRAANPRQRGAVDSATVHAAYVVYSVTADADNASRKSKEKSPRRKGRRNGALRGTSRRMPMRPLAEKENTSERGEGGSNEQIRVGAATPRERPSPRFARIVVSDDGKCVMRACQLWTTSRQRGQTGSGASPSSSSPSSPRGAVLMGCRGIPPALFLGVLFVGSAGLCVFCFLAGAMTCARGRRRCSLPSRTKTLTPFVRVPS